MDIPRSFQDKLLTHLPYADSADLNSDDDLATLGLDSMGVVKLLADLEDGFGLEMPDELLSEGTFATVGSLWQAVADQLPPELVLQ